MNANFWTTQNIIVLSIAMLAIPTGGGAALYLLNKSRETEAVAVEPPVTPPVRPPVARPLPRPPEPEPVEEVPVVLKNNRDERVVERLMDRLQSATSQSTLSSEKERIRKSVKVADAVDLLHTLTFNSGSPKLGYKDENYLVSALLSNEQFRKHRNNPNAVLAVLGYASRDGDPRNDRFALSRAQSTGRLIRDHERQLEFSGSVKSWCVGETTLLSEEARASCSLHNRAAEIWLIIDNDRLLQQIPSDDFVGVIRSTTKCSSH